MTFPTTLVFPIYGPNCTSQPAQLENLYLSPLKFVLFISKGLNVLFSAILRSPLHRMLSNRFILLSFKGRKSGKKYTIPVGYLCEGDVIEVISPRSWWKNLRGENASVTLLLKRQWRSGTAEAFHGDETVATGYLRFMQKSPTLIKMYHIELDTNGQPKLESVRQATKNTALIRIRPHNVRLLP